MNKRREDRSVLKDSKPGYSPVAPMKACYEELDELLEELTEIISPVYAVGGCVRDCLMGTSPKDFDFCTPLKPNEIIAALKAAHKRAYTVGARFGTVGCKISGKLVEITTFRSECYTHGSRNPEVQFGNSLTQDLLRRDFTCNAMAYGSQGLIDPQGGSYDISARKLIAVGEPYERLREDPLRSLRAARFAAQLGFSVDKHLLDAMGELRMELFILSKERVFQELDKLLCSKTPLFGIETLIHTGIFELLFPEIGAALAHYGSPQTLALEISRSLNKTQQHSAQRWAVIMSYLSEIYGECASHEQELLARELNARYAPYLKMSKALASEIDEALSLPWSFRN